MLDVYNTENSVLLAVPDWILSRARAHFLYNMHTGLDLFSSAYKRQYTGQYTKYTGQYTKYTGQYTKYTGQYTK